MCDDHLVCPSCGSLLKAVCVLAADNNTGFYVEFFLLEFDTAVGGLVAAPDQAGAFIAVQAGSPAHRTVAVPSLASAGALEQPGPNERGFDDDEAPTP